MPEGPVVHLYADDLRTGLRGCHIAEATTTLRTVDLEPLEGCAITGASAWGKYLFLLLEGPAGALHLRIHWGMFGRYTWDAPAANGKPPTAVFRFSGCNRMLYLYSVSMRVFPGTPDKALYDPRTDIMNTRWDTDLAVEKLRALPADTLICDALMDQTIFAGLGNAIKTEALHAQRIHPESRLDAMPDKTLRDLIHEAVGQAQLFGEARRGLMSEATAEGKDAFSGEGRYPWALIFRRKRCPRCDGPVTKAPTGMGGRVSHWCADCAVLYK